MRCTLILLGTPSAPKAGLKDVMLVSNLFMLSKAQMRRNELYFPLSHGVTRVDDRRILRGIIFVVRNGLRWRDVRWSGLSEQVSA